MARSSLIPGFRFHPTDVELVMYYLKRKLLGRKIIGNAVAEVNIYDFIPWDLPDKSSLRNGDLEWFFFCPKSKKYSSGSRFNRATEIGFWKATGKDKKVTYMGRTVATIKTLVFHLGHAGSGQRTDWVMHEYKMEDEQLANAGVVQDMYVICKVFEKSGLGPKNGAQYGAPFNEEEWDDDVANCSGSQAVVDPNTVDHKQKGPAATMNMTVPRITGSLCITKPGSSAVTYSANENTTNTLNNNCNNKLKAPVIGSSSLSFSLNERYVDVPPPVNEDMMLFEDLDSFLEPSPEDLLNGNNENQGVEVAKSVSPNKVDDGIYDELVNFINLDDLNGENLKTDGAAAVSVEMLRTDDLAVPVAVDVEYTFDEMLRTDDLDADLREFYVD